MEVKKIVADFLTNGIQVMCSSGCSWQAVIQLQPQMMLMVHPRIILKHRLV